MFKNRRLATSVVSFACLGLVLGACGGSKKEDKKTINKKVETQSDVQARKKTEAINEQIKKLDLRNGDSTNISDRERRKSRRKRQKENEEKFAQQQEIINQQKEIIEKIKAAGGSISAEIIKDLKMLIKEYGDVYKTDIQKMMETVQRLEQQAVTKDDLALFGKQLSQLIQDMFKQQKLAIQSAQDVLNERINSTEEGLKQIDGRVSNLEMQLAALEKNLGATIESVNKAGSTEELQNVVKSQVEELVGRLSNLEKQNEKQSGEISQIKLTVKDLEAASKSSKNLEQVKVIVTQAIKTNVKPQLEGLKKRMASIESQSKTKTKTQVNKKTTPEKKAPVKKAQSKTKGKTKKSDDKKKDESVVAKEKLKKTDPKKSADKAKKIAKKQLEEDKKNKKTADQINDTIKKLKSGASISDSENEEGDGNQENHVLALYILQIEGDKSELEKVQKSMATAKESGLETLSESMNASKTRIKYLVNEKKADLDLSIKSLKEERKVEVSTFKVQKLRVETYAQMKMIGKKDPQKVFVSSKVIDAEVLSQEMKLDKVCGELNKECVLKLVENGTLMKNPQSQNQSVAKRASERLQKALCDSSNTAARIAEDGSSETNVESVIAQMALTQKVYTHVEGQANFSGIDLSQSESLDRLEVAVPSASVNENGVLFLAFSSEELEKKEGQKSVVAGSIDTNEKAQKALLAVDAENKSAQLHKEMAEVISECVADDTTNAGSLD